MAEFMIGCVLLLLVAVIALQVMLLIRKHSVDLSPLRQALESTERIGERAERTVREEIGRNREEASKASQLSRQEVAGTLKSVGDSLGNQLVQMLQTTDKQLVTMRDTIEKRLDAIQTDSGHKLDEVRKESTAGVQKTRTEVTDSLKAFGDSLNTTINGFVDWQRNQFGQIVLQVKDLADRNEKQLTDVRTTVEQRLKTIQDDNNKNLEQVRQTVDEKLQGTLEKRLGESFKLVSERLEQVYKGLGEMQNLAVGVGDLKRVLTNVKARGAWGEVQLERMLEQILSPNDYEKNVATKDSGERVEFAIRLPGRSEDQQETVWLPIDAKFPLEDYQRMQDAHENSDGSVMEASARQLEIRIKGCAADISAKYLNPPRTTDFGILFLPTEGLFAEVVRRPGLQELLQREYKVVIAGPTTLWSILNSLQMGFRTLAIQKRSSEVWNLLGAVKAEFGRYGDVLDKVQKKLQEASNTIDTAAVRTRAIERKLRGVQELPSTETQAALVLEYSEEDAAGIE